MHSPAFIAPTALGLSAATSFAPPRRTAARRGRAAVALPRRRVPRAPPACTETTSSASASSAPAPQPDIAVSTAVSSSPTLNAALADAASRALANLAPGGAPTAALVFVSVRYSVSNVGATGRDSLDLVVPRLRALIPELRAVVGCAADGVIGAGPTGDVAETQDAPAVSLTLMRLPRISVRAFHVMPDDLPSPDAGQTAWHGLVGAPPADGAAPAAMLVFADPSFAERGELDRFLSGVEYAYAGSSVVGAVASAGAAFAKGHMFCTLPRDVLSPEATSLRDSGLVGLCLSGDVQLDCLVSPGCRPIGPEFEVRRVASDRSTILELELVGRPSSSLSAVGQLKSVVSYATPEEKRLLQDNLHVGVAVDDARAGGGAGGAGGAAADDAYVARRVIGVDMDGGGISVAQRVRTGQRVRFLVQDAAAAAARLDGTMQRYKRVELANSLVGYSNPPFGAMVFVDAGRGRALFREAGRETRDLAEFAAGVPVAGCFSGAQIGPCGAEPEGRGAGAARQSVVHNAGNLIALVRRRSGMSKLGGDGQGDADQPAEGDGAGAA